MSKFCPGNKVRIKLDDKAQIYSKWYIKAITPYIGKIVKIEEVEHMLDPYGKYEEDVGYICTDIDSTIYSEFLELVDNTNQEATIF